jgi:hypothetical protein
MSRLVNALTAFCGLMTGWWGAESFRAFTDHSHFDWANNATSGFAFASAALIFVLIAAFNIYMNIRRDRK